MATTKKTSTKAKTKTTNAKAKSTKKTTTKKTTAAKAATKKTTTKAVVANKVRPGKMAVVTLQTLRRLNVVAAGLFLILAAVAGSVINSASYQLTLGHMTKDEVASKTETVLAPAVQSVYDVELRWLIVATMLLSAVLPILYLTKLQGRYADYVTKTRMQPLRWIDFAVTGALAAEIIALLSGVSDIATLKLLGGIVAITAVLGLISERQNNTATSENPVRSAYYASLFTGALSVLFVAAYAVATVVYGGASSQWYTYSIYAVLLVSFGLLARNMSKEFRGANYLVIERNYLTINILAKVAFAAVLIAGFVR